MKKLNEKITLEEAFEELDELVKIMENSEIPLEQAFDHYKKGMELLQICNQKIDLVEKNVLVIDEKGNLNEF